MKKKILAHIAILLILTGGFCNVYIKGLSVSSCGNQLSAFAADDSYTWESVTKDDLVTAFKYYCKSRNLAIEGSIADAVTKFTTSTFNDICNTLGIDSTALQAELKKTAGGNLGLRFLFTQTGVNAYNRIFAEFLQNNDMSVGDTVDDEELYSGRYWQDLDGNGAYVFESTYVNTTNSDKQTYPPNLPYQVKGTYYYLSPETVLSYYGSSYLSPDIHLTESLTLKIRLFMESNGKYMDVGTSYNNYSLWVVTNTGTRGYPCIIYNPSNGKLFLGAFNYSSSYYTLRNLVEITNSTTENGNVYVTTNNNTINNNTYNNNYTIIYNDGDYYDYDDDDEPDPSTPPGGGGGGGGDDPDPDEPPIVDPTPTPDPSVPDWDIELPEMPVGNEWLLYGLEKKFPWDIPFNLMYMLSLFAAEPETPHFQGTLDLKVVQWDYDIDLAPFDDIARNVRNFEFVGFIIGLMLLTRKLIWG